MSDDDQIIVKIVIPPGRFELTDDDTAALPILGLGAWVASFDRWQRWVDADFPGAT